MMMNSLNFLSRHSKCSRELKCDKLTRTHKNLFSFTQNSLCSALLSSSQLCSKRYTFFCHHLMSRAIRLCRLKVFLSTRRTLRKKNCFPVRETLNLTYSFIMLCIHTYIVCNDIPLITAGNGNWAWNQKGLPKHGTELISLATEKTSY